MSKTIFIIMGGGGYFYFWIQIIEDNGQFWMVTQEKLHFCVSAILSTVFLFGSNAISYLGQRRSKRSAILNFKPAGTQFLIPSQIESPRLEM